ncbi:MAG: hypothetical protein AAF805_01055 [Planctomycetota bacterium]
MTALPKPRDLAPTLLLLAFATPAVLLASHEEEPDAKPANAAQPFAEVVDRPTLPPTLTSGLGVPAGEMFHLGERMTGDFTVSAYNRGTAAVTLWTLRDKKRELIGEVSPGETAVRRFRSGDGLLVENRAASAAKLKVEVWGTRDLAMYYTPSVETAEHAAKDE